MTYFCYEPTAQGPNLEQLKEIRAFVLEHQSFYLLGHREPDGDCVGSQLALASLLRRLGKDVFCLQDGPFDRPETEPFAQAFLQTTTKATAQPVATIVLDCSTPERVSERYQSLLAYPLLVIDHHLAGKPFGEIAYIDPSASATTQLLLDIFTALDQRPNPSEAGLLFFGLVTDTGFFRHCDGNSPRTFHTAFYLTRCGASVKDTYQLVYGNRDFNQRKLLGKLLAKAESLFSGRLIICSQSEEDKQIGGPNNRSSDELYSLLQTVKGVEVIVLLRQEKVGLVSVGLRATNSFDVAAIASAHGGGGHRLAAGFNFYGSLQAARTLIEDIFAPLFADH